MFSSTTFMNSSTSPFGPRYVFGQSSNPNGQVASPTGGLSSFGSHTGASLFGGTSTGVFGATASPSSSTSAITTQSAPALWGSSSGSGFSSAPMFGQSTSLAFGPSTTPAFGQSTTLAFGQSTTPAFGQSTTSAFGQSTTLPFGQSTTPAFGQSTTSAFGQSITSVFSKSTMPGLGQSTAQVFGFGQSTTPAFGQSTTSVFSQSTTPAFGQSTTLAFSFGQSTMPILGQSTKPIFGQSTMPILGQSTTPIFGQSTTPIFGQSTTPIFGQSTMSTLGQSTTPTISQSNMPIFGQSTTAIFGQSTMPTLGQPTLPTPSPSRTLNPFFGGQTRLPTVGIIGSGQSTLGGKRGGSRVTSYSKTVGEVDNNGSGAKPARTGRLVSISAMNDYKDKSHEELMWEDYQSGDKGGFGVGPASVQSNNPFSRFTAVTVPHSAPFTLGTSSINFPTVTAPPTSPFTPGTPSINFPAVTVPLSSPFIPGTPSINFTTVMAPPSNPSVVQQPAINTVPASITQPVPSPWSNNKFSFTSPPSIATPATSSISGPTLFSPPFTSTPFAPPILPTISPSITSPSPGFAHQSPEAVQTSSIVSHLPAPAQISTDAPTTTVRYGISSKPVADKPAPVRRLSSLLNIRHLSHRQNRMPLLKYNPKADAPKVPFFSDALKAPVLPRENPRALFTGPTEEWSRRDNLLEKLAVVKHTSIDEYDDGKVSVEVSAPVADASLYQDTKGNPGETSTPKVGAASSNPKGDSPVVSEQDADVMKLMPKLKLSGYYTEPTVEELALKERSEPGFCSQVKDFVVGRLGYGSIKFLGETDVRQLDLESEIQFNDREVVVYMDEAKKPPVGQGLNKPAEITLSNIKCRDKTTGKLYVDGPKVDKYKERLMKKAAEQGAEFVSYNPVLGDWKFRVRHF